MSDLEQARRWLQEFKGDTYLYGAGVLPLVGSVISGLGQRPALVRGTFPGSDHYVAILRASLAEAGLTLVGEIKGARPNAPREDLCRIADEITVLAPDLVISFGGGSTLDATKAAIVLYRLGGEIDAYFGTGLVSRAIRDSGKDLVPHLAIQTVASSAAHLTKYANITDLSTGQKKLIVDGAIVPARSMFDYQVTYSQPPSLTADGALDGFSHCLEVLYGAIGTPGYAMIKEIACLGIRLIIRHLPSALEDPRDDLAREALCLATDLGGYCIMLGGTNGGHLTSFSLVDILSHGRACAMMNPYYTVLFAPAIEDPLRAIGSIYREEGLITVELDRYRGRDLGLVVAEAMLEFARRIGFPTCLDEIPGFSPAHIERALTAAKDPQLRMKLENMPIPLTTEMVDDYMRPVLEAARLGELTLVRTLTV
ncbi:MAG: iron-containing alcohol dehydrogenase [Anaerolineae bacterium]